MQRAPGAAARTLGIELRSYRGCIWINLCHTMKRAVDFANSGNIRLLIISSQLPDDVHVRNTLTRSKLVKWLFSSPVTSSSRLTSTRVGKLDVMSAVSDQVQVEHYWLQVFLPVTLVFPVSPYATKNRIQ